MIISFRDFVFIVQKGKDRAHNHHALLQSASIYVTVGIQIQSNLLLDLRLCKLVFFLLNKRLTIFIKNKIF